MDKAIERQDKANVVTDFNGVFSTFSRNMLCPKNSLISLFLRKCKA